MQVNIEESWKKQLESEFSKNYFNDLVTLLKNEKSANKTIYPPGSLIFNAFFKTPFNKVKVVIIGQDPYHNPGQANGLCFSVAESTQLPPSLKNIFQELNKDLGIQVPKTGNLTKWAEQGVLLLNTSLTVRKNEPASHSKIGWQYFTDSVIKKISAEKEGVVFLLWGRHAKEKQLLIDKNKHFILTAAHPSPFSASNGFFGCRHFSKTNELLVSQKKEPIDWAL